MITIENTINSAIVYADSIDPGAEGLIRALCGSPISKNSKIRIMPDVHPGKGCAIGTTMTLTDTVAPGLVGTDIGCGMTVCQVSGRRIELQKLDTLIRNTVPSGRSVRKKFHRFAEQAELDGLLCSRHIQKEKALASIGTLGGGNHFIELDQGEDGRYWLVIHSGSRRLGTEVAAHYQKAAFEQCPDGTPYEFAYATGALMDAYFHDLAIVQRFAELNRQAIASDLVRGMKLDIEDTFSTVHNYIDTAGMILRKGAVSAKNGEQLIIPMNMRDGCLLCVGKGNPDWNESAPHGAGRLFNRAECRQSFMSLDYHLTQMPWAEVCRKAVSLGYLSHQAGTCGLHVHVSRAAFGDTSEKQDAVIARILYFFEKHWEELLKFSRRTPAQLDRWAARYGYQEQPKDILEHAKDDRHASRYTCVNLTNADTIEFRIFRGTLRVNTIFATLQLLDRICDVALSLSDDVLKEMSWTTFAAGCEAPELVQYLKERRLYVNEPVADGEEI